MPATTRKAPLPADHPAPIDALPPRRRAILIAAVGVLMEKGYARASTLEIATRARVSKRELYAEFGSKRGILEALIDSASTEMLVPLAPAEIGDRHALASALTVYGAAALSTLSNPYVLAMYRLAIAEAPGNTELGEILDASGREPNRRALVELMRRGQAAGFVGAGDPGLIAREFFALLIGDLMLWLLVGVAEPPSDQEIRARAERATAALLTLHPV
ncbi:MAG: TetR/AcrR family transcriptional regulator [Reyranella sp.]|uniref:TetR/AcrR family transcriptional regulator n=1 Tax=Reyranella sp. TaxID=1929291 RepID=UPI001AD1981A|nr:TetR/AcrR family transcriptional regulator [Reyranella sp.]MBN9089241.1 TetR/AcrR family transcriptional regulator [Reyranella sp.]